MLDKWNQVWYNWECKDDGATKWPTVVTVGRLVKARFDVRTNKIPSEAVVKWSLMNSHHYIITPDTVLNVSAPTAESEHLVLGSIQAYYGTCVRQMR